MAIEMCCGSCNKSILIETTGVVVACPHCGAHLSIPADIPDIPVTPAHSDQDQQWSLPPTATLLTSDDSLNNLDDEFSKRETIIVPRAAIQTPELTGNDSPFNFSLEPPTAIHSDKTISQIALPGWPAAPPPESTSSPIDITAAEKTSTGSSSETTPDFSWMTASRNPAAPLSQPVDQFGLPQISSDAPVEHTAAAKTTPDFSWMSDTVASQPSPLSFSHPQRQLQFGDAKLSDADSPFAGTVVGGMEHATAAMPDFSAALHPETPPSEPISIQLQLGAEETADQPPTLFSPNLSPALFGADVTNPTLVLDDVSRPATPFAPEDFQPTEPLMTSSLPQVDAAIASASMASLSVQMRPHAMTHTTDSGLAHPQAELPAPSNQMTMIILGSYASLLTIYVLYVTFFSRPHQLESLPDLKTVQQAGGRVVVPRPEDILPAGHQLKLGQTERFGNLKVTPLRVTRGPLKFFHYTGASGGERDASDPVLKLWIRFENVSDHQTFAPLDTTLLAFHPFVKNDVRSFNVIFRERDRKDRDATVYYPFDRMAADSEWRILDQHTNEPLPPHAAFDSFVPSQEGMEDLEGNVVWRVHFRKGFGPQTGNGVTTLVDVEFNMQDIRPDA